MVNESSVDDFNADSRGLDLGLKAQKSIISEAPRRAMQYQSSPNFTAMGKPPIAKTNTGTK